MMREPIPGPGQDGEELSSSPSSSSENEKAGQGRPDDRSQSRPGGQPRTSNQPRPGGPVRPAVAAGFAEGGAADVLAPGAELAGLVTAAIGTDGSVLGTLTDQEVLGVLGAVQKMAAWAAWGELVTLAEFASRRPGACPDAATGPDSATSTDTGTRTGPRIGTVAARAAAEEAAWKTGEQWTRMLDQSVHAVAVTTRLPHTLAALGQGLVSDYKVRIIQTQTADLTTEDVAKADVMLAAAGQVKNPPALRDYARRQVARLDPEAATRKKERGRQNAYVRAWQEDSGNMGLSAREMPNGDGQIAWQNIEERALDLHAAGVPGTTGQLQVQAMLDFLLGRATPGQSARQDTHDQDAHRGDERQDTHGPGMHDQGTHYQDTDEGACQSAHDQDLHDQDLHDQETYGGDACQDTHGDDSENSAGAYRKNARTGARGGGRGGWACNPILIVPWDPALGRPSGPAELPGYGLLDQDDTMDLLHAAGQDPASRWCLTATGPDGTAVAHGCAPGARSLDSIVAAGLAATGEAGTATAMDLAAALKVKLEPLAKGACDHAHAEPGYRPSRKLRHLVMARSTRCTAWGCGRPAAACDQDHTTPWDDGGITCECGLAPLCRHHHQIKQTEGWTLRQPEPGVLVWVTPTGLTRTTTPTSY